MKLVCTKCGNGIDFPGCDIRLIPVDLGDAQAFQTRNTTTGQIENHIFVCPKCRSIRAQITGQATDQWARQTLTSVKVFDDPTPNSQINMRIVKAPSDMLDATSLDEESRLKFFRLCLLCAKKLVAVYKHLRTYKATDDRLLVKVQQQAALQTQQGDPHVYLEHAQELLIEFDEFLVQIKSTLDYLVKVPRLVLGEAVWGISAFGEKGEKVIKALENNVPTDKKKIGKGIAVLIIKKHQPWLTQVISARDRLNHMLGEPVAPEVFMVFAAPREGSTLLEIRRPMWSADQSVRDFIQVIWANLIRLVEDFIVSFLCFKLKPNFVLFRGPTEKGSARSPWVLTTEKERARVTARPGWEELDP